MNGQADCVVIDNAPAQEYVKANPGLKILDTEFANEDYAIGVAKGNTSLLNAINTVWKNCRRTAPSSPLLTSTSPPNDLNHAFRKEGGASRPFCHEY